MAWTVEVFLDEWTPAGSAPDGAAARVLFDAVCDAHEGCAVLLRGEEGEMQAKRSVLPTPPAAPRVLEVEHVDEPVDVPVVEAADEPKRRWWRR